MTILAFVVAAAILPMQASRCTTPADATCSTFVLPHESSALVGHNLDDYTDVSGLIIVNARGVTKENVTLQDIQSLGLTRSAPRLSWTSRYGSVTYSVFGREFPDGGLNEAGLYVGEMTLMATKWPDDSPLPRMYHHQWIQYLLDSCATVDEVLASLTVALPEGHCRWHFLVADRSGRAAVIEFLEGEPVVYAGESLPYSIACNDPYQAELDDIRNYDGFGGTRDPAPHYELEDPRFRWAAVMLSDYDGSAQPADYAFSVLDRLDLGNRKWAIVCDVSELRMYVQDRAIPERAVG